jgi:hypothetical protein
MNRCDGNNDQQPHEGASANRNQTAFGGGLMIPAGFVPGNHDIICGKVAKHHSGNRWCRSLIEVELQNFWETNKEAKLKKKKKRKKDEGPAIVFTREEKAGMVSRLLVAIQNANPHTGGFVRVDQRSGRWIRVPDTQARKKILEIMLDVADGWSNTKTKDDSDSTKSDTATSIISQNFLEQYVSKQSAQMQAMLQETKVKKRPRIHSDSSLSSHSRDRTSTLLLRTNRNVVAALHLSSEQHHATMNHSNIGFSAPSVAELHDASLLEPNHIPSLPGDRASHTARVARASAPSFAAASFPRPDGQIHEELRLQNFLGVLEASIPDSAVYNATGSDPFEPNPLPG